MFLILFALCNFLKFCFCKDKNHVKSKNNLYWIDPQVPFVSEVGFPVDVLSNLQKTYTAQMIRNQSNYPRRKNPKNWNNFSVQIFVENFLCFIKLIIYDYFLPEQNKYSHNPNTGHSNTGHIRKPDVLTSGFQMVNHSKTRQNVWFLNGLG